MRNLFLPLAFAFAPVLAVAQSPNARFVEVIVTDTVRLPFMGMDYDVRMPNPYEMASANIGEGDQNEKQIENLVKDSEKKAVEADQRFVEMMKTNGLSYQLRSTEHAEDYMMGTARKAD